MVRIVALCGSLRRESLNHRALLVARDSAPRGCGIALWDGLAALPPFSPDLDRTGEPTPPPVEDFRRVVGAAHGLLIACPEYAHGIPGAFKNALDWLVGDVSFPGKPVALLNVAPRASHAQAQLREVLTTMSARIVEEACCTSAFPRPEEPNSSAGFERALRDALAAFAAFLRESMR
jgi:NAD(P)H-dependent FMN reductase